MDIRSIKTVLIIQTAVEVTNEFKVFLYAEYIATEPQSLAPNLLSYLQRLLKDCTANYVLPIAVGEQVDAMCHFLIRCVYSDRVASCLRIAARRRELPCSQNAVGTRMQACKRFR